MTESDDWSMDYSMDREDYIEAISAWAYAVGRELFPRGYVRDVYGWSDGGDLRFAWVMTPEKLARALDADGEGKLPFRGPLVASVLARHGAARQGDMLFSYERTMVAADFLQRFASALPPKWDEDEEGEWIDRRFTFIPEPGYPWPADRFYSAKAQRWVDVDPEPPEWLLPEPIVDEGRHINSPGADLCKLFDAEFGHQIGAVLARYARGVNDLMMATHAMGTFDGMTRSGSWDDNAAAVNACGGLLFPSLALGPIPATNFGPYVLIADVGTVLNALKPMLPARTKPMAYVYSSDAWTGRTGDFLADVAIATFEQMHGHSDYMYYIDTHVWQTGPQPDAPELSGPGFAERVTRVTQLKRELRERFNIWRRDLTPEEVEDVRESVSMTKARYGYLEAKIAGVMPMREFPLAVGPAGMSDGFRSFLRATGFVGELLEVELPPEVLALMQGDDAAMVQALGPEAAADYDKRDAMKVWASMQYGWHILDVVREHSPEVAQL